MRYLAGFTGVLLVVLGSSILAERSDPVAGPATPSASIVVQTPPPATAEPAVPDPSPTAAPTATPEPAAPTSVTMAFSGEVLSHGGIIRQAQAYGTDELAYNYVPMFAEVAPLLESVDFAVCHVETPVSSDNVTLQGYPIFNAPREMPAGLRQSGYDGCSTASNHSYDMGPKGVRSTLDRMEEAGLPQAGMARTAEEAATPTLYDVGGVTVGHLSYTYSLNGFVLPADQPYLVNVTDPGVVLAEARAAKEAGADFVVLSIQWGNEYQVDPSDEQISLAETFLGSPDIDLIMGAHVHVVQPTDRVNGKWVVYGLGNFLSNQSAECCPAATQNGIMAFVEIAGTDDTGYEVTDLSFLPSRVDRSDYTIVPVPVALADPDLPAATRTLYEEVLESTTEVVNRRGAGLQLYDWERELAGS